MKAGSSAQETRNLSAWPFEVRGAAEQQEEEEKEEEEGLKPPAQPCLARGQPPRVIPLGCEIQMQN